MENDGEGRPRILRIREATPSLTHRTWVAFRNFGCWQSVERFFVHYVVQVGDVNNDGRVLNSDASMIYPLIPTLNAADDERADVNGDGRILSGDASIVYQHMPSLDPAKPIGH